MNEPLWFGGWDAIARIAIIGVCAYVGLIAMLRVSGKRTLSKMNAFDFVVTIALGSTLATILLDRSTPLIEGLFALGLLIALQLVVTFLSVRSQTFQKLIKAEPTALVIDGRRDEDAMRRRRITVAELQAALRESGLTDISQAASIHLETDGTLSVVPKRS